jgi:rare lipoprotein A
MKRTSANLAALFSLALLTSCSTTPPHQAATQPPVPVVEAQAIPTGAAPQASAAPPAPPAATAPATTAKVQPGGGGYLAGDGPGDNVPPNLAAIPDAVPQIEPLHPYANRPYVALGQTYTPLDKPGNYKERGIASWYGKKFHGQHTSSGEVYDMYGMTAAHPTLPIPSYARVTNTATHKSVVVRINDRGPFLHDRIMDLSYTAAYKLGMLGGGSGEVEVESLAVEDGAVVTPIAAAEPVQSRSLAPEPVTSRPLPPEPVAAAAPVAAPAATAVPVENKVYLQIGAFRSPQGAESFLAKMRAEFDGSGKDLVLYQKDELVRVHIGPYASADEARKMAEKMQAKLGFKPLVSLH